MATITESTAYALSLTYDELVELKAAIDFIMGNSFPNDAELADEGEITYKDDHLDHGVLGDIAVALDEVI